MGQYSRTRIRKRISNLKMNKERSSGGDGGELVDSGSGSDEGGGGYNNSSLSNGKSTTSQRKDCEDVISSWCSATTTTKCRGNHIPASRRTAAGDEAAAVVVLEEDVLWTRSKKSTITPQRKGQRPFQLCVGNCPNGPTPPLSSFSSSETTNSSFLTMNPTATSCIKETRRRIDGDDGSNCCDGGGDGVCSDFSRKSSGSGAGTPSSYTYTSSPPLSSSSSHYSHSSSSSPRWQRYSRLLAFRSNNFYHHRHSLRWDFFGHASVSFTLLCGSILILLASRNDLLGQCVRGDEISEADKPIPVEHVEGVLKTQVKLPCNVSVPTRDDKLHMVLWFRDRDGEPIYRYDVRDKAPADAKRWSIEDRLFFQVLFDPAHLSIQNLDMRDEGVYRCRVDFKNSPTRNIRVNLTIVVPPEQPVIYDSNGLVTMKHVGPYNEGSDLVLTCEVSGGRPRPRLQWWLENNMIDGDYLERNDGILVNRLVFPRLNRHHLNAEFVCQASNTNQALPPSTKVMVNLNLRPLQTTITTMDNFLLAERRYDIECITVGSRPPAVITWWKNSRQINQLPTIPPSDDKNITKSILQLIPTIEDDGKILTCRGDNPWIPGSAMEARWRLNVHYSPRVYLKLGDNLIPDDIKEGDDVYFECSVQSNPPHTRLNWFHEGREVRHNASQRVIISNNRLVLQKVTRRNAGNYTCSATNSAQGTSSSQSNVLSLRVKFVPTCKSNTEGLIGAMKKETVEVICEMAADPPKVEFHWTFNNSGVEVIHVPRSRFTYRGTQSTLNYTIINEMDYGTLQCWGSNAVGKGLEGPCIFQIVSAGRPFPPKNCTIYNHTEDSLNIACIEGFDGGLPQHFVLEVVDLTAKKIKLNASSKMPSFSVEGMEPGVVFRFIVYAVNGKGRSEPFILDGITFRGVAKLTGQTTEGELLELNPLYAIIVGCFVVLIVFLIVAIIAVWKRSRRRKPPVVKAHKRDSENSNNFQTGDALTKIDPNSVEDIGNPDVVPNKSDRSGGIRGFIRIHKTPPARRRKKDLEVKNNGETVALTLAETPDGELHRNHHNHHRSSILTSSNHVVSSAARESRI